MFVYSRASYPKIVHKEECPYAARIKPEHATKRRRLSSMAKVRDKVRIRLCRYCSKLARAYRYELPEIVKFCREHGLKFQMTEGKLLVESRMERWQIVHSWQADVLVLYHENYSRYRTDKQNTFEKILGYHVQKVILSIQEALEIVYEHQFSYLHRKNVPLPVRQLARAELTHRQHNKRSANYSREHRGRDRRLRKQVQNMRKANDVLRLIDSLKYGS